MLNSNSFKISKSIQETQFALKCTSVTSKKNYYLRIVNDVNSTLVDCGTFVQKANAFY